jgi:hypothetical protein
VIHSTFIQLSHSGPERQRSGGCNAEQVIVLNSQMLERFASDHAVDRRIAGLALIRDAVIW